MVEMFAVVSRLAHILVAVKGWQITKDLSRHRGSAEKEREITEGERRGHRHRHKSA